MAIVLEVSLTLNPVNQIAYLADFTSLVVGTQYVINAAYLQNDTRFTFNGNLDITLTKPPLGVPAPNTVVPAEVTTVPLAATPPPPVTYPFSIKQRLDAFNLNAAFEFDPGPVPPHSALGGAGKYKYWVDTSVTPAVLRQCIVPRASTTYVANQWATVNTISDSGGGVTIPYLPLTGGTLTGNLTIAPASGWGAIAVRTVTGNRNQLNGFVGANQRWEIDLGDGAAESTGNAGSNFGIARYADNGVGIDYPLTINRATGIVALSKPLPVASGGTGAMTAPAALTALGGVSGVTAGNGLIGGGVGGAPTLSLSAPVSIANGGTASTTAAGALINLGGYPIAGGTITGSTTINGGLSVGGNITTSAGSVNGAFGSFGNIADAGWLDVIGAITGHATLDITGAITGHNTITTTNAFLGPVLAGGVGNAGVLGCWNTANRIAFRFEASPGFVYWRVDEAVDMRICTHANGWNFDLQLGGGPVSRQLYFKDNSSNVYSIYVDLISDDRIKSNIVPTTVDALAVLQQVPVCEFDVDARVASWLQTTGQDEAVRRQAMEQAKPAHVGIGFVANQLKDVIPEAVTVADQTGASIDSPLPTDLHSIAQQSFIPYLVRAVQQLTARLEALEGA